MFSFYVFGCKITGKVTCVQSLFIWTLSIVTPDLKQKLDSFAHDLKQKYRIFAPDLKQNDYV